MQERKGKLKLQKRRKKLTRKCVKDAIDTMDTVENLTSKVDLYLQNTNQSVPRLACQKTPLKHRRPRRSVCQYIIKYSHGQNEMSPGNSHELR